MNSYYYWNYLNSILNEINSFMNIIHSSNEYHIIIYYYIYIYSPNTHFIWMDFRYYVHNTNLI